MIGPVLVSEVIVTLKYDLFLPTLTWLITSLKCFLFFGLHINDKSVVDSFANNQLRVLSKSVILIFWWNDVASGSGSDVALTNLTRFAINTDTGNCFLFFFLLNLKTEGSSYSCCNTYFLNLIVVSACACHFCFTALRHSGGDPGVVSQATPFAERVWSCCNH